MTLILKSDNIKNGIILNENAKKFEEATSTSGCDLEMSEITSSMPNSFPSNNTEVSKNVITNTQTTAVVEIIEENAGNGKIKDEESSDLEDVIDGFSVFSFVTEDDLIKFSIKNEKIETENELENVKSKKIYKSKKQNKLNKANKESTYTEDGNDIYDFQANCESSPSGKNFSVNFKKIFNKKFASKFIKQYKNSLNTESTLSPSEGNSSSTSVTEFRHNLVTVESPRPTSNDDNNVVSTTTPDNVNIELENLNLFKSTDKIQSVNVVSPLKTATVKLYKLDDELSTSSHGIDASNIIANVSDINNSETNHVKICNNPNPLVCDDEKYQQKIIPTKFSVDLLTKIIDIQAITDETNKCLDNNTPIYDCNTTRKSADVDTSSSLPTSVNCANKLTAVVASDSPQSTNKMTSAAVKNVIGNNCCSSAAFRDGFMNSAGSCKDNRTITSNENPLSNDDDGNNDNNNNQNSVSSPMQSWLELHNKGLIHQQKLQQQQHSVQTISNSTVMPTRTASSNCFNSLNNSSHAAHSANSNKSQYDSAHLEWKNNYFDNSKHISNSVQKYNQNFGTLSHDLVNNIRYQQEQSELMNALRLKHENSKIPKPLVHMGLNSLYKADHSLYKNPESRFQAPNVHNYFLSNSQLPTEFNTANVFKARSDLRCYQNPVDSGPNKDSFSKALPSLSSSNFKMPETIKRRGQWCDMHVKIAYFIYRSQKRMSMIKTQELNSQLSHLIYSQKIPPNAPAPPTNAFPPGFLQHSSPYLDYRSSQSKPDPGYLNYQPKSSSAFLNTSSSRPLNPYHSIIPQNLDSDYQSPGNPYEDHHQSPEHKWFRLLSNYMTSHSQSSLDRPSPEILSQLYGWYQQFAQNNNAMPHFNPQAPSTAPMQSSNIDPNMVYLRKYMEHLSSCLGSMKGEPGAYLNNSMTERDMQLYLMKQQQYQKALMSKYQTGAINKSSSMNHMNPLLINPSHSFYNNKKLAVNPETIVPQYPDCLQSLVNQKYRLTQDQIRQMRQESLNSHQTRNGFSKLSDLSHPKRRKLNSESIKVDPVSNVASDRDESKVVTDLTGDNGTDTDINLDNRSPKSRDNINFHLQTMIPDNKE